MKRHNYSLHAKGLTWTLAIATAFSSVPSIPVHAEEDTPSVFIVTEFPEYKKLDDGTYADEDMRNKYSNLKAEVGTEQNKLGLPETITLNGYLEAEGPEFVSEYELLNLDWKLKSDAYAAYSTDLPAGSYAFVPDFASYTNPDVAEGEVLFDEIKMEEGTRLPELTVVLEDSSSEADPLTQDPSETDVITDDFTDDIPFDEELDDDAIEDGMIGDDIVDDIIIDDDTTDDVIIDDDTADDVIIDDDTTDDAIVDDDTTDDVIVDDDTADDAIIDDGETIFDNIDDSILGGDSDNAIYVDDDPDTIVADPPVENTSDITVSLLFQDPATGINVPYADEFGLNEILLKAEPGEDDNTISFQLPCNYPLAALALTVTNLSTNEILTLTEPAEAPDFSDGTAKTLVFTDASENSYHLTMTLANEPHILSEATCSVPATCSVCGYTDGITKEHSYAPATCTTPQTCTVCGATEGGTIDHNFTPATCIKRATCTVCGTETGEYANHTSAKKATCTEPETCSVCNQIITPAFGHDWKNATCTVPKTCARCGATEGKALGHDMDTDWLIDKESTDSEHGTEIRYCSREACDHSETRPRNIIGAAERNVITGVDEGANYKLKTAISFTASGSGMANSKPIDGDVRFVPSSWKVQNTPGEFKDNYSGAFSVSIAGNYALTVNFQKQIYQGGEWKNTDTMDSKVVNFSVGQIVQGKPVNGSENGIRINPQTGDTTPIIPLVILLVVAVLAIIGVIVYQKKRK